MTTRPQRRPIPCDARTTELVWRHGADILTSAGMEVERRCLQHGSTSVYAHSLAVTCLCVSMARALRLPVHERALVRGALLHDYFLYDWHERDASHRLHGFWHPRRACANAMRDFGLEPLAKDMVLRHMFPLTPLPPAHREGWLLCVADKCVAMRETLAGLAGGRRPTRDGSARA
ncbi:HD domain-containing protein [Olsenella massiliensis]|uniref:HD domain-containing protein n=1 Tax=Olsenella massiliensis TaxID=1622075 RepID=UPI00071D3164|nr:HD domain-containing protein [Olsenella massiliensis]